MLSLGIQYCDTFLTKANGKYIFFLQLSHLVHMQFPRLIWPGRGGGPIIVFGRSLADGRVLLSYTAEPCCCSFQVLCPSSMDAVDSDSGFLSVILLLDFPFRDG